MPERPQNVFLLLLPAASVSWMVPLVRVYFDFPVLAIATAATLTSALATAALVIALILFTSWAEKRGHHLSFLGPFLLLCLAPILLLVLIVLCSLQWKMCFSLWNGFSAFLSCGYIVYFSSSLMRHPNSRYHDLDTISLFLHIVVLFFNLFSLISGLA